MFPETGKNYKKIEKRGGTRRSRKGEVTAEDRMFPGTGPLSVFNIIKRRSGDVKIKRAV